MAIDLGVIFLSLQKPRDISNHILFFFVLVYEPELEITENDYILVNKFV